MTDSRADAQLIASWVDRLQHAYHETVAILLKGSHARGNAGPHSDIDFDVLLDGKEVELYPVWIEPDASGRLRHISVAVQDLAGWLAAEREPEPWAFGLPVREDTRLLWARTRELHDRLDRPWRPHPPGDPELEDFVEGLGKTRNAFQAGDELGLRLAAQSLPRYAPTLLRPLNLEAWATSPRSALDVILAFPVAPDGYRGDMLTCLGLVGSSTSTDVMEASHRLVEGTLSLLREHQHVIGPLLADDLAELLGNGAFHRYVAQNSSPQSPR